MVEEELPVEASGHALVAKGDERVGAELLQRQAAVGQRAEAVSSHEDLIKGLQLHRFQARLGLCRGGDDGKIHLAVFHRLHRLRGGVVGDAQADAGVLGVEGPQLLREVDVQGRLGGADADGAVLQGGGGAQLRLGILDLHRRRRNAGVEQLPLGREGHAPVGADEEHAVELAFQPVHGVGDVGLIVAQHPRRLGKVLVFGNVVKDFVVFPIHIHGRCSPFDVPVFSGSRQFFRWILRFPAGRYCHPLAAGSSISAAE